MKWLACIVLAGCISPVMHFGGGKTGKEAQHDTLQQHFLPARLSTEGTWKGPITDATIRVYADDQYRAQNLDWRRTFGESVEYANAVLGPQFGVRLVADYREWEHHEPSATLTEDLEDLRASDHGGDALAVIGLTSSLGLVSATFDQLGVAQLAGRYVMLRGYADLEERKEFARFFEDLSAQERENAHLARRQHKNAAVLLHELGHILGVSHERAETSLMAAAYTEKVVGFSAEAHEMIASVLDQRLGRGSYTGAPRAVPAAAQKPHDKLHVRITAQAIQIEGIERDESEVNIIFSAQAAADADTDVIITKDKGVPQAKVIELMDHAKTQGLKNFAME